MTDVPACMHCGEDVRDGEPARDMPIHYLCGAREVERIHLECALRMVVGSVGHQLRECSCFGGTRDDPEGMTRREAARAACDLFAAHSKGALH